MVAENQIALQLYTMREYTQQDMLGTLQKLGEIGYKAVELAGYGNSSAPAIRAKLDELGIAAISMHAGIDLFQKNLSQLFTDLHTLGCNYAVVPYLAVENRNQEYVKQLVGLLNQWGKLCQSEGIQLCYHNHNFEFDQLEDGSTIWEIITSNTDPELVKLELDLYWAAFAEQDPAKLVRNLSGRVPLLHYKDMSKEANRIDVPVGEGVLPWPSILEESRNSNAHWYIVEQDHPRDAFSDVSLSLQNLQHMLTASPVH